MTANIALCWPNYAPTATFSQGSWESAYPITNLNDPTPTLIARTVDATTGSTKIRAVYDAAVTVRVVSEINCTLSLSATRRIMAGSTAGASDILDRTDDVWAFDPTDYGITWRTRGTWWGNAPDSSVYGVPWNPVRILAEDVTARYWQFEYNDTTNPDTDIQLGNLWMSPMWRPTMGAIYGVREGYDDYSSTQALVNGGKASSRKRAARNVQFELPLIEDGADEYLLRELFRYNRTVEDILYLPTTGDPKRIQMLAFAGRLTSLNAMTAASYKRRHVSISLQETI